jgi:rare lipoprotein A
VAADQVFPMHFALLIAGFVIAAALPMQAVAQQYRSHWNTSVVAAPLIVAAPGRSRSIITSSLASAGPAAATPGPNLGRHHVLTGIASYYWQDQMTSSGERFDKHAMTAAHKTLPMHSRVKVTHVESGRSVIVRINDRGPFKPGRVIDLSDKAADILGFKARGLAQVQLEVIQ